MGCGRTRPWTPPLRLTSLQVLGALAGRQRPAAPKGEESASRTSGEA
jgi:hypothetical protein